MVGEYDSHSLRCEVSNFVLGGGVMPKRIKGHLGIMDIADIEAAIPPKRYVYAEAKLLLVENTHNVAGGTCTDIAQLRKYREVANKYRMNIHVDGPHIFNIFVYGQ